MSCIINDRVHLKCLLTKYFSWKIKRNRKVFRYTRPTKPAGVPARPRVFSTSRFTPLGLGIVDQMWVQFRMGSEFPSRWIDFERIHIFGTFSIDLYNGKNLT